MSVYTSSTAEIVAALRRVADQIEQAGGADPRLPAGVAMEVSLQVRSLDNGGNAERAATIDRLAEVLGVPVETYETGSGELHRGIPVDYCLDHPLAARVYGALDTIRRVA